MTFGSYVALGDSVSIDLYPGLDAAEREGLTIPPDGLGAVSLLHVNDDGRWPEFSGRDLSTEFPGLRAVNLSADGATTTSVLDWQLPRFPDDLARPVLVTLTVGGNDLLALLGVDPGRAAVADGESGRAAVTATADRMDAIVEEVRRRATGALIVIGTVYDPSDGSGDLGDGVVRRRELEWLAAFNDRVRRLASEGGNRLADIHDHFLGHGLTEPHPGERWYWRHSVIEPSARGASEVRRLWLETLGV